MYKTCDEGLAIAIENLRVGRTCADVHNSCQKIIDRAGFTGGYRKRTGYSIGIAFAPDWGEGNILSLNHDVAVPLQPGMVFHVPVTLRDWGKFTVAVSETVLVTEGAARPLGKVKREMLRV
jgi:Xaa-Pro dipeptidase